jgi:hypothetical protein
MLTWGWPEVLFMAPIVQILKRWVGHELLSSLFLIIICQISVCNTQRRMRRQFVAWLSGICMSYAFPLCQCHSEVHKRGWAKNPDIHCEDTIPKTRHKYSQKRNCVASVPISTFMCLWAIFILPRCRKICGLVNPSQKHKCGNWDWGSAIPFLGIHKWDFRCSVDSLRQLWEHKAWA